VPVSYGAVVSDMGKAVKPHGPHATPKGTHFNADVPAAKMPTKGDDFGAGIM
jgi:stage V sporulation protein G